MEAKNNYFKRKKRKKESRPFKWKVSEKKVFKKNTTRHIVGSMFVKAEVIVFANLYGWRFFLKPAGLELFFLNTWNLSLLSFFIFCFEYSNQMLLYNSILPEGLSVEMEDGRLGKGYEILKQ
ncbi:MAG: hypothetical protein ABI549_08165 [Flavobacterium sp.]|uniref:hypothetical protein n=1 Tax=Flavobacterium sp. TaxID=239 RepID=UPI0032666C24